MCYGHMHTRCISGRKIRLMRTNCFMPCSTSFCKNICFSWLQDLEVSWRRSWSSQQVLKDACQMLLACIFELREYCLHHVLAPAKFAALPVCECLETKQRILQELRNEWTMVLEMEQDLQSAELLHAHCRYVRNQSFRELMGILEKHRYQWTGEVENTILAWYPRLQSSSNLENLFSDMESAIRRSGRSDAGSLSNLMAVAIRGLSHRMQNDPACGVPVVLENDDFQGPEVQALKPKIWTPASAAPCD